MKAIAMNKIDHAELPEDVKKLNGDSADLLKETIKELEEALKKAKEKRRGRKS